MVRMVRSHAISRNLVIDGFPVKISYPGQGFECDICGNSGHIAKNCSLRGKCLECTQFGHFQRNCPVHLCRLQRSVDSLDPLPSSDVSGTPLGASPLDAGPPPVVLSGVPPIAPLAISLMRLLVIPFKALVRSLSLLKCLITSWMSSLSSPSWLMVQFIALFLPLQARLVFSLALLSFVLRPKFICAC